jgi:deoxycytidylate deaminase
MDCAFNLAAASPTVAHARVAASLVWRNREIICMKTNVNKSHPLQAKYCHHRDAIMMHAENHVIISALRSKDISIDDLENCSLYISRAIKPKPFSTEFHKALAKPCAGCTRSIYDYRIGKVFYTVNNNEYACY